ncbi:peptidoglycan-associated lipoprotein Pal [Hankyongella ginsenosidimutans]|uniref:Peptidoglycan-associated protein n=1 Tax=Hankyongella ginsenosidimutans TaxID=1763828 RepID=A0A4D7C9V4_9SPHN|nr:peptidoglycan-associated lipoprotein Pal [Hankyongella ginsenosidimutans]QCI79807.1 peptidoglycan-associated lipoprotein Pal [Hankyongella ginsenosidimutans]TXG84492.1 MAG: peptidoglycan-associated lipoprotein Pal [Sphingomonadales bacterium]
MATSHTSLRIARMTALAGAVALLAACSKKEELPPAPPPPPAPTQQVAPTPTPPPPPPVTASTTPGSLKDFIETAGADRVFFEYDSYALGDTARATLAKQAEWLKKYGSITVTIEGHCDERGTREYNLALGERRATAVKSFLVSAGVPADRLKTISYGKERPEVAESNEEAWSQNRRGVAVLDNPNS